MPRIWKIFARLPSDPENDYAVECYQSGVIAVGWNRIGDLDHFDSRESLKRRLAKVEARWVRGKPKRVASWAASLWHFRNSVRAGHFVLCPDSKSGRLYVGRVLSKRAFYDASPLQDRCPFAHRRRVKWFGPLHPNQIRSIWKNGRFGGRQTVTAVQTGLRRLSRFLRPARAERPQRIREVPLRPDQEWGRAAEKRAMAWLRKQGRKPLDVAHRHRGWDIECDGDKFEVKGRKSPRTLIRLTEGEWKQAKKFGRRYMVLVFTAATKAKLKKATPHKIADPVRTERWQQKIVREYFWSG